MLSVRPSGGGYAIIAMRILAIAFVFFVGFLLSIFVRLVTDPDRGRGVSMYLDLSLATA
jgi:hypothetical protein